MSSQEYQPPIYQIPNHTSQQLKVVLDFLDILKRWDFDALDKLWTSDFTQQILPTSLGSSPRTKSEYIEYLHNFRDSLNGAALEIIIYEVNESKGKIWVHVRTFPHPFLLAQGLFITYRHCFAHSCRCS
ncbi:hypothetical protein V8E52_006970 [Russula decolorans]